MPLRSICAHSVVNGPTVAFGDGVRSSVEHLPPSDYAIPNGHLVRFGMGVRWRGYNSDIGRTFVCGQPSAQQT